MGLQLAKASFLLFGFFPCYKMFNPLNLNAFELLKMCISNHDSIKLKVNFDKTPFSYLNTFKIMFAAGSIYLLNMLSVSACSCAASPEYFCQSINMIAPDLIVLGVKTGQIQHGMSFRIIDIMQGEEQEENILIWGDNGNLCRVYVNTFSQDDTLVLAVFRLRNQSTFDTIEKKGDYELAICGRYYLGFHNNNVVGPISKDLNEMTFNDFKDFNKTCQSYFLDDVLLYPNPSDGLLSIQSYNSIPEPVTLRIYNILGVEHMAPKSFVLYPGGISGSENLDLAAGIYLVEIIGSKRKTVRKLVIK